MAERPNVPQNGSIDCASLRKRLQETDFALVETILYLDAYPRSQKALEYYHRLRGERETLSAALRASCGPDTAFENLSETAWEWTKGPWPWQNGAE